jgi:hypothetical protein
VTISKAIAALTIVALFALRPILPHRDFADYGRFADDAGSRFNERNVLSNLGFVIVGAAGVLWAMRHRRELADDSAAVLTLFGGVIATAFGSAYFHLTPLDGGELNRFTLLWDRIPMTVAFAGLLALVLRDRVFHRPNRVALPMLALIGIATTLYWYWSWDLYPYAFFQLFAAAGTLLMISTLRPSFTESGYVAAGVFLFGISKVFEDFDRAIHSRWHVGGHPLKHIAGAMAALMILFWLQKRRARV